MSAYHQFIDMLRQHMLQCPSRQWLHMDCPGCGMQRSILALLEGHWKESLHYHPAALPLLALGVLLLLHLKMKFKYGSQALIGLQLIVAGVSVIFYVYKITHHQIIH